MRIAIIGLGRMGRALADRLLDDNHEVSVWNRTPGRAAELQERGARVLGSVDDVHEESDAVLLCLADDRSTLDVATPKGEARASWARTLVVNTATVAPDAITALVKAYGDRFVAAEILGAPQAVRSGTATFVVGGPASAREALAPLWNVFAGVLDVGDRPETAAIMKLLNNQMLLAQVAVIAETVRAGRAAGIDDTTLAATLRESKMMPEGLRNRIDVLFDPDHAGWFNSVQAVKDVTLALELAQGGAPLPVTEAARDAYRQVVQDGWHTHDVTTLVEYGRLAVAGLAGAAALSRKTTYETGRTQPPGPPRVGSTP
jgi:3-hydroxyisobutyrate dehydrogenase-like beta-hydroxyacid dehydrogenase